VTATGTWITIRWADAVNQDRFEALRLEVGHNGITDPNPLQQTSATKSTHLGHAEFNNGVETLDPNQSIPGEYKRCCA